MGREGGMGEEKGGSGAPDEGVREGEGEKKERRKKKYARGEGQNPLVSRPLSVPLCLSIEAVNKITRVTQWTKVSNTTFQDRPSSGVWVCMFV